MKEWQKESQYKNAETKKHARHVLKEKSVENLFQRSQQDKQRVQIVHTDVYGPMETVTPESKHYFLMMIDDYSGYTEIFLMSNKSEVSRHIRTYVKTLKNKFNNKPKILRLHRGKEYVNHEVINSLNMEGIKSEFTAPPYTPQQWKSGAKKQIVEMARCMLISADMSNKYWRETVTTANYLQNRLPYKANKTTYMKNGLKRNQICRTFTSSDVKSMQRSQTNKKKWDNKARKLCFVGYSDELKALRLLDKQTDRIAISRDIVYPNRIQKQEEKKEQ